MKQYSMVKGCQKGDKEEEEKEEMRVCVCTCVNANTLILFGSYYMLECLCAPREPSSGWMFSHWCREASGRCLSGRRDQRHLVQGRGCMNVGNPPASSELQYRVTKKKMCRPILTSLGMSPQVNSMYLTYFWMVCHSHFLEGGRDHRKKLLLWA